MNYWSKFHVTLILTTYLFPLSPPFLKSIVGLKSEFCLFMPFLFKDLSWGLSWVIWTFWLVLRHNENASYHLVDANLLLSPFAFWSWPLKYDLQILSHLWPNEKTKSLHQNIMNTAIKWFEFAWGQSTKGKTKRQFWDSNQFNRKHESTIIWKW